MVHKKLSLIWKFLVDLKASKLSELAIFPSTVRLRGVLRGGYFSSVDL